MPLHGAVALKLQARLSGKAERGDAIHLPGFFSGLWFRVTGLYRVGFKVRVWGFRV